MEEGAGREIKAECLIMVVEEWESFIEMKGERAFQTDRPAGMITQDLDLHAWWPTAHAKTGNVYHEGHDEECSLDSTGNRNTRLQ